MARTTSGFNTNTSQPGRTGGGGDTSGGSGGGGNGGGSTGTTDGIYSGDKVSGELATYSYLGNNPGVPPTLTEVALADGQYYGTFTNKAVAEQNQTYFAYFNGIGGTGPEIIDQTAYYIKYIIDTKGNVVDPAPSFNTSRDQETGLFNLIDNFELGKRAVVKQIEYDPTQATYKNLSGLHTITGVGFMENIAVTEIGLKPTDYTPTMSFNFTAVPYIVGDMNLDFRWFPPSSDPNEEFWVNDRYRIFFEIEDFITPKKIPFTTELINNGGWEVDSNTSTITALSGSAETNTRIKITVQVALRTEHDFFAYWQYFTYNLAVYKNNIEIANSNNPLTFQAPTTSGYSTFTTDWIDDYQVGDVFEAKVIIQFLNSDNLTYEELESQLGEIFPISHPYMFATDLGQGAEGNFIKITQDIPANSTGEVIPDVVLGVNTAYAPYFTGSYNITSSYSSSNIINPNASHTLLVLSDQLSSIFRSNPIQTINTASQSGIDGMNFNKCTIPFGDIQPGDFIRFEYNKNNVRLITDVGYWSDFTSGSTLESLYGDQYVVWKISPPIGTTPTGSIMNLNHFNMYRIVNNGNYIILDVPRTDPNFQTGTYTSGILQPEFSSEELINNFNEIITTLTEKETIN